MTDSTIAFRPYRFVDGAPGVEITTRDARRLITNTEARSLASELEQQATKTRRRAQKARARAEQLETRAAAADRHAARIRDALNHSTGREQGTADNPGIAHH